MRKSFPLIVVLLASVAATTPAPAPPTLPGALPMTANDRAEGAKAHKEILQEFGDAYPGTQANYARTVGQKIALQSGLSNASSDFTITLLNSPVNNAFAIPGGYVYVTRQLMGLMNNEAELASVLGHEVGHVAARHAAKRQKRATRGGLFAAGLTILGGVFFGGQGAQLGQQIGSAVATRYVMKYSRAQEYQADDLGVSYLGKAAYEPMASSTMLASLAAQTALDSQIQGRPERSLPEWASSHPDPASRVVRAAQNAQATAATGHVMNRDQFLTSIDGMLYDDDPKQGVVEGRTFRHPDLKVSFTAPTGFVIANNPTAVVVAGSGGQAQFGGNPQYKGDLRAYVGEVFTAIGQGKVTFNYGNIERTTINGLPVAYASALHTTQSGQIRVTVYTYEFSSTEAYHFYSITPATGADPFGSLYQSVRRLTAQEAAAVRPRKIDVLTVRSGDTIASLSARMAYDDFKTERFLVLNALKSGEALRVGKKIKIVVFGCLSDTNEKGGGNFLPPPSRLTN